MLPVALYVQLRHNGAMPPSQLQVTLHRARPENALTTTPAQKRRKAAQDVAQRETSRIEAAILVATRNIDDDAETLTNEQIADRVDVSRTTLYRWMHRDSEFAAMVADAEGQIRAAALRVPTANTHTRIKNLDKIARGILRAIDLRAETYSKTAETPEEAARAVFGSDTPPWASTGLFIERKKIAANGKTVTDWELDTASVNALKGIYEHVAKQMGQFDDTVNVNHSGRVDHVHRNPDLKNLTDDELTALEAMAHRVKAGADA